MVRTHLPAMKPKTPAIRPTLTMLPRSFFIFIILNRRRALSGNRLASLCSDPLASNVKRVERRARCLGTVHPQKRGWLNVNVESFASLSVHRIEDPALTSTIFYSIRATGFSQSLLRGAGETPLLVLYYGIAYPQSGLSCHQRMEPLPIYGRTYKASREGCLTATTRTDLIIIFCQPPIIPQAGATGARIGNAGIVPTFEEKRKFLIVNECGLRRVGNQCIKTPSRCTKMYRGGQKCTDWAKGA